MYKVTKVIGQRPGSRCATVTEPISSSFPNSSTKGPCSDSPRHTAMELIRKEFPSIGGLFNCQWGTTIEYNQANSENGFKLSTMPGITTLSQQKGTDPITSCYCTTATGTESTILINMSYIV
ncbi:hypothetical protein OUZ56_005416 [Daphnia magna]|uniref:Uncharacterized protein n=1 Tax=Daphnia magna TaxID=35525 RepID=A0ABQ9YSQ9_9CRUS|nr:hypothetical protein OUZ56_005416 [Daphnia magna]